MNIIGVGLSTIAAALAIVLLGRAFLARSKRSGTGQQPIGPSGGPAQPRPSEFVVLETDSPSASGAGVLAESIGIETLGGKFSPLLAQGSALPSEQTVPFSTGDDNQNVLSIRFYRGGAEKIKDNTFLGEIQISGYSEAPRGVAQIRVTIKAADGRVSVGAVDGQRGNALSATLVTDNSDAIAAR